MQSKLTNMLLTKNFMVPYATCPIQYGYITDTFVSTFVDTYDYIRICKLLHMHNIRLIISMNPLLIVSNLTVDVVLPVKMFSVYFMKVWKFCAKVTSRDTHNDRSLNITVV